MLASQCKHDQVQLSYKLLFTLVSVMSSVILMLRTYAFTGRRRTILAALSVSFFSLVGVAIWVMSTQLNRLSRRPCLARRFPDSLMVSQCRPCLLSTNAAAVLPLRINRFSV